MAEEPKKGTLDDLVNLIKTIPPEEIQKLKDVFADGQITRDELPILAGVGFRNWKTLAAIVVIIATVIGGWVGYVSSPKTDAELASLIKSGFEGQSKQLDNIVKAIEAKPAPTPVDPDKKPSKGAIPDEVSAKIGRLTLITSKETVDQWIVPPGSPCEWDADGKRLTLVPTEAVEFSVGVVTQKGKSLAWCLVKAGVGPKPKPPEPEPGFTIVKHFTFVGAEANAAGKAVANDASLRSMLKSAGVAVHVVSSGELPKQSAGFVEAVSDNGGVPIIILQDEDGNIIDHGSMTTVIAATELATKHIRR